MGLKDLIFFSNFPENLVWRITLKKKVRKSGKTTLGFLNKKIARLLREIHPSVLNTFYMAEYRPRIT